MKPNIITFLFKENGNNLINAVKKAWGSIIERTINTKEEIKAEADSKTKKMFIESYGCQMNFSDSEIVASILYDEGFSTTKDITAADLVFVNTCSIREKAEQTIFTLFYIHFI